MKFLLPRHLFFDLDGTLLDSLPGIAFSVNFAFDAAGLPRPDANLGKLLGPPIRTIFAKIVPTDDTLILDRLESDFRSSYDMDGWLKTKCFRGARETLEATKAEGHSLFIVSNKPREVSLRILEREGLSSFFERIYTRDSRVPRYASKEEILSEVLNDLGISASECMMIGDTMEDVTAAAANRMPVALMEHGYGDVPPTVPIQMRLRSFSDFLRLVDREDAQ